MSETPVLICVRGHRCGQVFLLSQEETSIGRAPECEVVLEDPSVSWHHARVIRTDAYCAVLDLGSTNGTYFDGERIDVRMLADRDQIQIGDSVLLEFRLQGA